MIVEELLKRLKEVSEAGAGQWTARCPAHNDLTPSLSVSAHGDKILLHCHAGCETEKILQTLGLTMRDLFQDEGKDKQGYLDIYDYRDEEGTLLYQVCRMNPKGFVQRRPGIRKKWIYKLQGVRVLYRLPELLEAERSKPVFIVEGEKDVNRLMSDGLIATTNSGGAGKWRSEYNEFFRERDVVVIPDNDTVGIRHAKHVVDSLRSIATSTKLLELEGLSKSGDVSDWLHQGHSVDDLLELVANKKAKGKTKDESCDEVPLLAYETNILSNLDGLLDELGLAGERRNAKLLYLALTSRLTDRPVSIWVRGPSSGGKSWLVNTVLKAFPASAYFARSSMSEKSLIYSDESFSHRYIVLYELAGLNSDFANYIIRTLLSEGRIIYETVETVSGMQSRLIEKEGPTGLILTTTKQHLHQENATRMWCIDVEASPQQTRAVLQAEARSCGPVLARSMERNAQNSSKQGHTSRVMRFCAQIRGSNSQAYSLQEWMEFQQWIEAGETRVVIPFAEWLADHTAVGETRLRRDFYSVLNLIKTHAILHQKNRERDEEGRIIAAPEDYKAVHELVSDIVGKNNQEAVPETVRKVVLAVKESERAEFVTYEQLATKLEIDKSNVSRYVTRAKELGYLDNMEKRSGKPAKIVLLRELPDEGIFPSPDDLIRDCSEDLPLEMVATALC